MYMYGKCYSGDERAATRGSWWVVTPPGVESATIASIEQRVLDTGDPWVMVGGVWKGWRAVVSTRSQVT